MELLVVEDEPVLGKALHRGLREDGHDVVWTRSGREGLERARQRNFDVLILDLMLPDLDGFTILRALRGDGLQTPVLVLTALGSVDDRVKGLRDGADDYLVKPFAFPELLARLHALHRRSLTRPAMRLQAGALELDLGSRKVTRGGETVDLSPTVFSILELLMRHAGQTVTRKMLNEHVWGEDWTGETNVIDVHINHLRRKLDREHPQRFIHTVRGQGYVLRTTS